MPRWLLQLAILVVVVLAIFWAALARKGENVLTYCEPECAETVDYRAPPAPVVRRQPDGPIPTSDLTPRRLIVILIAGLVGFALGRLTASRGPSAADVSNVITAAGTTRVNEATLHNVAGAPALLGRLQNDAITAVQRLLPPRQIGEIIALILAAALAFALFFAPPGVL